MGVLGAQSEAPGASNPFLADLAPPPPIFYAHELPTQSNGTSAPSLTSTLAGPLAPSQLETTKHSGFPDDACLILSKDLYFTRSQCTFMAFLFFVAFLWGKLG